MMDGPSLRVCFQAARPRWCDGIQAGTRCVRVMIPSAPDSLVQELTLFTRPE